MFSRASQAVRRSEIPSVPRLAQELFHYILDCIADYTTLCACSLAAPCLRPYAQKRLFTSVRVDATLNSNNLLALCHSLQSRRLAKCPRHVEIIGRTDLNNLAVVPHLEEVIRLLVSAGCTEGKLEESKPTRGNVISYLGFEQVGISDSQLLQTISLFPHLSTLRLTTCDVYQEDNDPHFLPSDMTIPHLNSMSFLESRPPERLLRALSLSGAGVSLRSLHLCITEVSRAACQTLVEKAGPSLEHYSIVPGIFDPTWPVSGGQSRRRCHIDIILT